MPPSGELLITPARGGKLTVDRVTVEFPSGAVDQDTVVRLEQLDAPSIAPAYLRLAYHFRVTGLNPASRAEVPFSIRRRAQVTVNYATLGFDPKREWQLRLFHYDSKGKQWDAVGPMDLDRVNKRLSVSTASFSEFAAGFNPSEAPTLPPTMKDYQVSLLMGTASAVYPIEVPLGPGGLTPKIPLVYSSGVIDGMNDGLNRTDTGLGLDNQKTSNQAGWAGFGWGLELGSITRDFRDSGNPADHVFYLNLNGVSHRLIQDAQGVFHTEREEFARIESIIDAPGAHNTSGHWWRVTTKDGTQHRFGYNADSEHMNGYYAGWYPYKWSLDQIKDTNGNEINLQYYEEQEAPDGEGVPYCRASYLSRISYAGDTIEVVFNRTTRDDWELQPGAYYRFFMKLKLDSIDVRVKVGANWVMVRKYVLAYAPYTGSEPWWHKGNRNWVQSDPRFDEQQKGKIKLLLASITQCGKNATEGVANGVPSGDTLPATNFTYELGDYKKSRLLTASNGYGGQVAYSHEALTPSGWVLLKWRYRVNQRSLSDGLTAASNYLHDYGTARQAPDIDDHPDFRGHDFARVVDPAGHYTKTSFYTYGAQNGKTAAQVDILKGLPYLVEEYDSSNLVQRKVENAWSYTQTVPGTPSANFVHLDQADTYLGSKLSRVLHSYDAYGNIEVTKELADASPGAQKRTTKRIHFHNTSAWILDKVSWERVYEGENVLGDGQEKKLTKYAYDQFGLGAQNYDMVPTKGLVTGINRYYQITPSYASYETRQDYYSYGNLWKVKDGRGNITTTTWDGTYHAYPIRVDYPVAGLYETADYDYVLGHLTRVTDANGQYTDYEYDNLGRLTKVIRPGDTNALPTIEHRYRTSPFVFPYRVETLRKKDASSHHYTRTFYDGLGQELQRYSDGVEAGSPRWIFVNTHYNSRGLKDWECAPYFLGWDPVGEFYVAEWNDATKPRSQYGYDAMRRPTTVTNPDGSYRDTAYRGWEVASTDENRHQKKRTMDAFGRLVQVDEYQGTFTSINFDATAYATTIYGYDVLDNLTSIKDALDANPSTVITYDAVSRKTQMVDPDMGIWKYQQDAAGNLIRQEDARGKVIKIGYDALNRARRKTYCKMVWNEQQQQWVEQYEAVWLDGLSANSTIRIYDIAEMRAALNANLAGLESTVASKKPRLVWSGLQSEDGSPSLNRTFIAGVTTVRATHFNEMLQAVRDLRDNQGLNFTHQDGPVVAETRLIKLQDPVDLRTWVEGHEGSSPLAARVYIRYDDYSDSTYNPGNAKGRRTEMWDSSGVLRLVGGRPVCGDPLGLQAS